MKREPFTYHDSELDELKRQWKELGERIDALQDGDDFPARETKSKQRATTAKGRLEMRYRLLCLICLITPCWFNPAMKFLGETGSLRIGFLLFFLTMAVMKGIGWWKLAHTDYTRMTVKEALQSVYDIERWSHLNVLVGLLAGFPLIALFICYLYQSQYPEAEYMLYGVWTGLAIGGFIGLTVQLRVRRDLKEMREMGSGDE